MSYEIKEITEKGEWDNFSQKHPFTHLFQSWNWGEFKSPGWKPLRIGIIGKGEIVAGAQILSRDFMFNRKFFYIPRGPIVNPQQKGIFKFLMGGIKETAAKESAFAICIEPNFKKKEAETLFSSGFSKAKSIQPKDTSILDLEKNEEELLADMHPKSRQYLRKAEKSRVAFIEDPQVTKTSDFLKVMDAVRKRSTVLLHPNSYYKKFLDIYKQDKKVYLAFVKVGKDIDGGSILVGFGDTFYDLYGGPKGLHTQTKSSQLLKWGSIRMAKKLGYKFYDQMGLAPQGDTNHNYAGVTVFKERFGGVRVTYAGNFCLVLSQSWYRLWNLVTTLRDVFIKSKKLVNR